MSLHTNTLFHKVDDHSYLAHLHHFCSGAVWQESFLVWPLFPQGVSVVPVVLVPGRQEPHVPLALGHALLVSLADDVASRRLEKLADNDSDASLSQVVQVLQLLLTNCQGLFLLFKMNGSNFRKNSVQARHHPLVLIPVAKNWDASTPPTELRVGQI